MQRTSKPLPLVKDYPRTRQSRGDSAAVTLSAQLLIISGKTYDSMSGAALPFLRSRKDRLDVKTMFGGLGLAGAPDFIDDRVPGHGLFS